MMGQARAAEIAAPNDAWIADHRPVFSWAAVPGAAGYEVWVDGNRIAENVAGTCY